MSVLCFGIKIQLYDYLTQLKNHTDMNYQTKMLELLWEDDTFIENGHIHYFLSTLQQRKDKNRDVEIGELLLQHFSSILEKNLVIPLYNILEIHSLANGITREIVKEDLLDKIEKINDLFNPFLTNYQICYILINP